MVNPFRTLLNYTEYRHKRVLKSIMIVYRWSRSYKSTLSSIASLKITVLFRFLLIMCDKMIKVLYISLFLILLILLIAYINSINFNLFLIYQVGMLECIKYILVDFKWSTDRFCMRTIDRTRKYQEYKHTSLISFSGDNALEKSFKS